MSTEKLDSRIRQEQIAEAALRLVGTRGLKALNIARLARQVGLVPSAIYRHFEGKHRVIEAMLDLIRDRLWGNIEAVRNEKCGPLRQLRHLLVRHVELIRENAGIPRVVFSEDVYSTHAAHKAKLRTIIEGYLDRVAELIRDGQRCGEVRPDLDPSCVSLMFLGLIQPAAILWHVTDGDFDVTKHAEKAWRVFEHAVTTNRSQRS